MMACIFPTWGELINCNIFVNLVLGEKPGKAHDQEAHAGLGETAPMQHLPKRYLVYKPVLIQ